MKKYFAPLFVSAVLITLLGLCSCTNITPLGVKTMSNIDPDKRDEISSICHKIYGAMQQKNTAYIKSILSTKIKNNENLLSIDTVVRSLNLNRGSTRYHTVGEYLMTTLPDNRLKTVESNTGSFDNDYEFTFMGGYKENYVMLFTVPSAYNSEYLVSCVFVKEKEEWKLGTFFVGSFTYNGRSAPDLYKEAKREHREGNYFGAYLKLYTAYVLLHPAGEHFKYDMEKEIAEFIGTFGKDFKANGGNFPFTVNLPGSKHRFEFLSLEPTAGVKDIYPLILYRSDIPVSDTNAIKKQTDLLNSKIDTYMPNIKKLFDSVCYKVVNEYPNVYHQSPSYFVREKGHI